MVNLFWIQLHALVWKNWIVLSKHPLLNVLRCFILPVAYGIFLAVAQAFFHKPNNYGIGEPVSIFPLHTEFPSSGTLVWADGTDGKSIPSPADIMIHITTSFTSSQLKAVKQVKNPEDIPFACPPNFNFLSECFAAVAFYDIPQNATGGRPFTYTIFADAGLGHVDVIRHRSDYEKRLLPLQWAIDSAIIELKTGVHLPPPYQWPYTQKTNEEQSRDTRLSYIRGVRNLLAIAFSICFVGISYQLPGAFAGERANGITSHMKAMGLMDSARIISWHLSLSLVYLPAWVIVSITWSYRIFSLTNVGLILAVHVLLGLTMASWSFFIAAPFGKSPQLAAVFSTLLSILFVIVAVVLKHLRNGPAFIFSIIFPPGFYVFAIRAIAGYENHQRPTNATRGDPDNDLVLLVFLVAAIVDIFLWPWLASLFERSLYDAPNPLRSSWKFWERSRMNIVSIPDDVAISIRNLGKIFTPSFFKPQAAITAISDLSFDIPNLGIFVLLGSNGAGKSTCLSILGGLVGSTRGTVVFQGGHLRPPRGTVGIVPQKNVLFPELSCIQTLRVWRAVKWSNRSEQDEDIEQLLRDCDLYSKIHSDASTLSGGQKRKLQLAIGLIGGSKIVLIDECTSGVDPLSRRALWRTLTSFRESRTIVFTTHFLDEADLLADHIAILTAPGKLVAEGTPVALKHNLGEGYTIQVSFTPPDAEKHDTRAWDELLSKTRAIAAQAYASQEPPHRIRYHLRTTDHVVVSDVLRLLERETTAYGILSFDIAGTTIEDIFLSLASKGNGQDEAKNSVEALPSQEEKELGVMKLSSGRPISPLRQACIIFYKRYLVARRSWLTPVLTMIVAIAGCTISLVFLRGEPPNSCIREVDYDATIPLFLPISPIDQSAPSSRILVSPPGITSILGPTAAALQISAISDDTTFRDTVQHNFRDLSLGGVSIDVGSGSSLIAWEASPPGLTGLGMVNFATNILFNGVLRATQGNGSVPALIQASYESFPFVGAGTLFALKWIAFYAAAMAAYPAFFALYVSKERTSSVKAMQMSNGLANPVGLWLGHLMFDFIPCLILSTVIIIVFATAVDHFNGLGFFWLVLVLYGITGALFSYCVSFLVTSPLAAFAVVATYQVIMFVLYVAAYLLVLTYGKTSTAPHVISIVHFTISLASPVASAIRAALVSVNLFSLLCDGESRATPSSLGAMIRFSGPIVYLIGYSLILFSLLIWFDSGSRVRYRKSSWNIRAGSQQQPQDVIEESKAVSHSADLLRVLDVSKAFQKKKVVDGVSLGVSRDTIFALLGPNGAGKTTIFNMIRGDIIPDEGDVMIGGTSIISDPKTARASLGVCPQFTAIDAQLTVREHLVIYGRLKGLRTGQEVNENVDAILKSTSLFSYADRLASKLSGGNQRKLSLAIALIGNPSVVLIDEFSTGIDAKMKRDMWDTLRRIAAGKALIITTHSMEEASALSSRVGILARRLLAVGSTETLSTRYATYEVHFTCRTREEKLQAQTMMASIPGSRMVNDVATRFEVRLEENGITLAQLFTLLSAHHDLSEYTVEKASLESVFLKVIRENDVHEEDEARQGSRSWRRFWT